MENTRANKKQIAAREWIDRIFNLVLCRTVQKIEQLIFVMHMVLMFVGDRDIHVVSEFISTLFHRIHVYGCSLKRRSLTSPFVLRRCPTYYYSTTLRKMQYKMRNRAFYNHKIYGILIMCSCIWAWIALAFLQE